MTEKTLKTIVAEAGTRWNLLGARVIHRVGLLKPADPIVLVAVSAAHRGEAFAACEFIIDALKTRAPFWKRETGPEGTRWVEAGGTTRRRQPVDNDKTVPSQDCY
jgi:molybdopterin synthase catalytic subunit